MATSIAQIQSALWHVAAFGIPLPNGELVVGVLGVDHLAQYRRAATELLWSQRPATHESYLLFMQNNVTYTYDALNRLSSRISQQPKRSANQYVCVRQRRQQSVTYPNGVVHSYTDDTRNRLTNLGVNHSTTALASDAYTLDAAGHRAQVISSLDFVV